MYMINYLFQKTWNAWAVTLAAITIVYWSPAKMTVLLLLSVPIVLTLLLAIKNQDRRLDEPHRLDDAVDAHQRVGERLPETREVLV